MSSDGIEFRVFQSGDEDAINDCSNQVHGSHRSLDEWAFRFRAKDSSRTIAVAIRDGEIVAQAAGIPTRVTTGGKTVDALAVVDAFAVDSTDNDEKRRLLLDQTLKAFVGLYGGPDGFPLIFIPPGTNGIPRTGDGWVEELLDLPRASMLSRSLPSRRNPRRFFYRAEACRDWEPRLDDLWSRVSDDYQTSIVRDAEFALRRYAGNPSARYHRFVVLPRFSSRPVAFAAFRLDGGCCRWVDLVWDRQHTGALDLLSHLSSRLAAQTAADRESIMIGGDARGVARLGSLGFESEGFHDDLRLRVLFRDQKRVPSEFPEGHYVTAVDLEGI